MSRDDGIIAASIAVIVGIIGGFIWLIVHQIAMTDECAAKGGTMVRVSGGAVCAKLEIVR